MTRDTSSGNSDDESKRKRLRRRRFLGSTAALVGGALATGSAGAAPYGGSRHAIPGRLEAEDYDTDGSGYAYNDTTAGNTGGAYRSDDVDIEAGGSGYNVGWIESGEWLNYSVTIDSAGTYDVSARVASGGGGGTFTIEQDQTAVGTVDAPDTGGWQSWTTVSTQVDLDSGDHMLAIYVDSGGFNLDYLEFSLADGGSGGSTGGIADGTYRIVNVGSGKALEVENGDTTNGANVQQWTAADIDHHKWDVTEVSSGVYSVTAVHSGKALDVDGVSTDPGANVHQWDYVGGDNQHWRIEDTGDGTYRLIADHSGLALDVENGSTADGANVLQWDYHGGAGQRFTFEPVSGGGGGGDGSDNYPNLDGNSWNLHWSDEFDQGAIDTSVWQFATGGGCGEGERLNTDCTWGNNEEQYYTDGDNAWVENGRLIIEARKETAPNGENPYTSARLITQDTYEKQYGRVEVRARLPGTQGLWPAIWMLGQDIDTNSWPQCGEIDIMELTGDDTDTVHQTIHGPGYSGGGGITDHYDIGGDFTQEFHDFQLTWYQDTIKFWVDGNHVNTITPSDVGDNEWVFNQGFFIILNVAVGGTLPGYPDSTTQLPQRMEVEHVRVYDQA